MAASRSKLDAIYRRFLLTKYFTKGWGKPEHIRRIMAFRRTMSARENAVAIADPASHPITLTKEETHSDHRIVEGHFTSPVKPHLTNLIPKEAEKAYFQMVLPRNEGDHFNRSRPMCIQYAGTGDHFFWRRRHLMALPMVRERGIASILIENPFYGLRKPKEQLRSSLRNVTDIFVMGACLMLESIVLADFCQRQGYDPVVLHGISMGGHMASLGATVLPRPVGVVPALIWTTASLTFTKGVIADAIPWDLLQKQFASTAEYGGEILKGVRSEDNRFNPEMNFNWTHHSELELEQEPESLVPDAAEEYATAGKLASSIGLNFRTNSTAVDENLRRKTILFMRGIMDECTHLKNFDLPVDPELALVILAEKDAYMPREGVSSIPDIWKGSKLKYIKNRGHVSSYLFCQKVFRQAIYDVVDRYKEKYPDK